MATTARNGPPRSRISWTCVRALARRPGWPARHGQVHCRGRTRPRARRLRLSACRHHRAGAPQLRRDRAAGVQNSGYLVGYAIASDLLAAGNDVLVECVNPIEITRSAWRGVADAQHTRLLEVELFCSDPETHRGRVQTRVVDVPGLELPDWEAVQSRDYVPWTTAQLRIDTALVAPAEAAARIRDAAATLT